MKTEELQTLGLTEEQIKGIFAINGKDVEKIKTERDQYKAQYEDATNTLKSFEGIDPTKMREEIASYKARAEEAEVRFNKQITDRDKSDWLTKKFDEYGVTSTFVRKQLKAEAMSETSGLSWKDNEFFGFDDFMKAAKAQDASIYKDATETTAEQNKPSFTNKSSNSGGATERHTPPKFF